ncbi:hypothetical protein MIND_00556000 [Mycena indigotica]|uniref:Uncharacterized protein n=1 Tax=Mycena indigotica TaxID=2126181 RepID=A0A8H6WAG2_9AGAR|nr:uncharacterized protein MIND_00556000 [Mycena indigotica]KAF7307608.1 hypothetical protein MIND_00556000 [Mycena indigotica]
MSYMFVYRAVKNIKQVNVHGLGNYAYEANQDKVNDDDGLVDRGWLQELLAMENNARTENEQRDGDESGDSEEASGEIGRASRAHRYVLRSRVDAPIQLATVPDPILTSRRSKGSVLSPAECALARILYARGWTGLEITTTALQRPPSSSGGYSAVWRAIKNDQDDKSVDHETVDKIRLAQLIENEDSTAVAARQAKRNTMANLHSPDHEATRKAHDQTAMRPTSRKSKSARNICSVPTPNMSLEHFLSHIEPTMDFSANIGLFHYRGINTIGELRAAFRRDDEGDSWGALVHSLRNNAGGYAGLDDYRLFLLQQAISEKF